MEKIISDKYAIELIHSLSHLWLLFGLALLIFIIVCAALVARKPVPHRTSDKQANSTSNTHHDLLSELNKVQNELSAKSESFETLYASYVNLVDKYKNDIYVVSETRKWIADLSAERDELRGEVESLKRSIIVHKGNYTRLKKKYDELLASKNNVYSDSGCNPWRGVDLAD